MKKRTHFAILRELIRLCYKIGEIQDKNYFAMIDILNEEDDRMALESEE